MRANFDLSQDEITELITDALRERHGLPERVEPEIRFLDSDYDSVEVHHICIVWNEH